MRKTLKWVGLALAVVLVGGFGVLSYQMGGADQAYGLLRYGYPQLRAGELQVGDPAPDVELVALDGRSGVRLRDLLGGKPLVLIFGSYT